MDIAWLQSATVCADIVVDVATSDFENVLLEMMRVHRGLRQEILRNGQTKTKRAVRAMLKTPRFREVLLR